MSDMKLTKVFFWLLIPLQQANAWAICPPALDRMIKEFPEWKEYGQPFQVEEITTGLTNHNFKVTFPARSYFVRLKSDNSGLLGLDADREYFCTQAAASLGIAPAILYYLPDEPAMALPYIAGKPLENNRESCQRVLTALRLFHQSGFTLPSIFCPYGVIRDYYRHATALRSDRHIPLASYVMPIVEEIRTVIPSFSQLVPCHLDLYSANFLDDGPKIWIVDCEYRAMADPLYVLATLASSKYMSLKDMQDLLKLYLDNPSERDFAYFYLLSILADVRWWLWSYIQKESSQIQAPYLDFADDSLYQIMQKTVHPYYRQSLDLLNGGDL